MNLTELSSLVFVFFKTAILLQSSVISRYSEKRQYLKLFFLSKVINLDVCLKMFNGRLFNAGSVGQFCITVCFFMSLICGAKFVSLCKRLHMKGCCWTALSVL